MEGKQPIPYEVVADIRLAFAPLIQNLGKIITVPYD